MSNLVIFAGSQEINDIGLREKLASELEKFLEENKDKIKKVLYGGGVTGVMGQVFDICKKVGILIEGYSIERYRKYDEGNGVDTIFFKDDDERLKNFANNGDVFLALNGGLGTIKEVLGVKDMILESEKKDRKIYIPNTFLAFFTLLNTLVGEGMVYPKDLEVMKSVTLETIKI